MISKDLSSALVYQINAQAGKFLKNIKRVDQNKAVHGKFFLKINECAGKIPIHVQDGINVQGEFFLKNNKCADQNKVVQGEFFSSKLIIVHARLFGTLEYVLTNRI